MNKNIKFIIIILFSLFVFFVFYKGLEKPKNYLPEKKEPIGGWIERNEKETIERVGFGCLEKLKIKNELIG